MKRFLSVVLAVMLICTMLPAAFAQVTPELLGFTGISNYEISGDKVIFTVNDLSAQVNPSALYPVVPADCSFAFYSDYACQNPAAASYGINDTLYLKVYESANEANNHTVFTMTFTYTIPANNITKSVIMSSTVSIPKNEMGYVNPASGTISIIFTALASNGDLYVNDTSSDNNKVLAASYVETPITNFIFKPASAGTATFKYYVTDGTYQSDEKTITINVSSAAPTVTGHSVTVNGLAGYTFTQNEFTSRYTANGAGSIQQIIITGLPTNGGTLTLNGTAVTLNQKIAVNQLGGLKYNPKSNTNYTDSFTWKGFDGTIETISAATVTLTVKVNSLPTGGNFALGTPKNSTLYFTQANFTNYYNDADGQSLTKIQITACPNSSHGTLYLSGSALSGTSTEIATGSLQNLRFTPSNNYAGTATFKYKVYDGFAWSSSEYTVTITVGDNLPTSENITLSVARNGTLYFTQANFTNVYYGSGTNSTLHSIIITAYPSSSYGTLYYNNTQLTSGEYTVSRANLGNLRFVAKNNNGTASFTFKVSGDGYSYSVNNATVSIRVGDELPTSEDIAVSTPKNTTVNFTRADFNDAYLSSSGNSLAYIKITAYPNSSYGYLYYNNTRLTSSDGEYEISYSNLQNLRFTPANNVTGITSFSFKVSDDGNIYSTNSATATIRIGVSGITVKNDTFYTATGTRLNFTENNFKSVYTSTDNLSFIKITSLPSTSSGYLYLNNSRVSVNDEIYLSDLSKLNFRPNSSYTGNASFRFTMSSGYDISNVVTFTIVVGGNAYRGQAPYITNFKTENPVSASRNIILEITARDKNNNEPTHMSFAVDGGSYGSWVSYDDTYTCSLPNNDGIHTIKVRVRGSDGLISAPEIITVMLDRKGPTVLGASLSSNKRTLYVQFDEPIKAIYGTSTLYSDILLTTSGGTQSLPSGSAAIDGSTLTLKFNSAVSGNANGIRILRNSIEDLAGNDLDRDENILFTDASDYEVTSSVGSNATIRLNNPSSSSRDYTGYLDAQALEDIADSVNFSIKRLRFQLYTGSNSPASLSLIINEDAFNSSILDDIDEISLYDGSTEFVIDLERYAKAMDDYTDYPVVISISSGELDYVSSANYPYASRQVSLKIGSSELPGPWDRGVFKLYMPYSTSSSNYDDMIVIYGAAAGGSYAPLYSSNYQNGRVSADITGPGTYISAVNQVSYNDIGNFTWANDHIRALSARRVFEGTGVAGRFAPSESLTRGQFIKLLVTSLDLHVAEAVCSYTDVAATDWEYEFLASAVLAGIIEDGGMINARVPITREDMALWAYRAAEAAGVNLPTTSAAINFTDYNSITASKRSAVDAIQRAGIINGYPDGRYDPAGATLRGAAAKVVYLLMQAKYE